MTPLTPSTGVARDPAGGAYADHGRPEARNAALITALAEIGADQVDELLSASGADIAKLVQTLDSPPSLETAVQLAELYRSAISAAAAGDVPKALTHLAAFAALDPRRAETLPSDPALVSIRDEVTQLLAKLTFAAKTEAEAHLDQARQSPQASEPEGTAEWAIKPEVALLAAAQLAAAGGYANFVQSIELSQLVLDYQRRGPAVEKSALPPMRILLWMLAALGALILVIYSLSR